MRRRGSGPKLVNKVLNLKSKYNISFLHHITLYHLSINSMLLFLLDLSGLPRTISNLFVAVLNQTKF